MRKASGDILGLMPTSNFLCRHCRTQAMHKDALDRQGEHALRLA